MKTTKLFLSVALLTLTAITFGMNMEGDNLKFENELVMESWMTAPFNSSETDLMVENWMTIPFQDIVTEDELIVENWMTSPFGSGAELEALTLESWMITPFEATDDNCSEALMAAACN